MQTSKIYLEKKNITHIFCREKIYRLRTDFHLLVRSGEKKLAEIKEKQLLLITSRADTCFVKHFTDDAYRT